MTDTQRRSLREDIAEVLNDDNGYSHAVQTWAAIARDLLGDLDAAEARIKAVRALASEEDEYGDWVVTRDAVLRALDGRR